MVVLDKKGGHARRVHVVNTMQKIPIEYDHWGTGEVEYCHQWLSIIAVDDDGDMTVEPFMVVFDYDEESEACSIGNAES